VEYANNTPPNSSTFLTQNVAVWLQFLKLDNEYQKTNPATKHNKGETCRYITATFEK
jgi:hypothetical protein